jgi:hypothetical protein
METREEACERVHLLLPVTGCPYAAEERNWELGVWGHFHLGQLLGLLGLFSFPLRFSSAWLPLLSRMPPDAAAPRLGA